MIQKNSTENVKPFIRTEKDENIVSLRILDIIGKAYKDAFSIYKQGTCLKPTTKT